MKIDSGSTALVACGTGTGNYNRMKKGGNELWAGCAQRYLRLAPLVGELLGERGSSRGGSRTLGPCLVGGKLGESRSRPIGRVGHGWCTRAGGGEGGRARGRGGISGGGQQEPGGCWFEG